MLNPLHTQEIVFSSGLIIRDGSMLNTLAVFYDRVYLPSLHSKRHVGFTKVPGKKQWQSMGLCFPDVSYTMAGKRFSKNVEFQQWDYKWQELYHAGVLSRLPPPRLKYDYSSSYGLKIEEICPGILELENLAIPWLDDEHPISMDGDFEVTIVSAASFDMWCDVQPFDPKLIDVKGMALLVHESLYEHLLREPSDALCAFWPKDNVYSPEVIKMLQAQAIFRIFLPRISQHLPVDVILGIRDKVRETREGFAMHLQSLCGEVQKGLNAGATLNDIMRAARVIVETKLIPDYAEFRRQLEVNEEHKWGRVLDPLGKILAIDCSPWTPKFWGLFLSSLGTAFGIGANADLENLGNRKQAFQFMRVIDKVIAEYSMRAEAHTKPLL